MRALTLYPAIDLKGGQCVRLRQGEMSNATVYSDDPAGQARAWIDAGCRWLHVVDLDGAFAGRSVNGDAVESILEQATVPVQRGGGIRDMDAIEFWLNRGVSRVLLGSAAVKNPALVLEACTAFPGRVAIGIDARHGLVATEGWAEQSELTATDFARRMEDAGAACLVLTEISRDGMLGGLDPRRDHPRRDRGGHPGHRIGRRGRARPSGGAGRCRRGQPEHRGCDCRTGAL